MSKKNFINACKYSVDYMAGASKTELNLFCEIMGLPKSKVNYFIGYDPHGMVDIMEGYYCFNMSDIHVVIAEYEHWLELYKTNEEIARVVREWYYWSLNWREKHLAMGWHRISDEIVENPDPSTLCLPELDMDSKMKHKRFSKPVLIVDETDLQCPSCCSQMPASVAMYDYDAKDWWLCELGVFYHDTFHVEITHWKYIDWPDDTHYCNLKSWLMGWRPDPKDVLPQYKEHQAKELTAAHARVEAAKEELRKAMEFMDCVSF